MCMTYSMCTKASFAFHNRIALRRYRIINFLIHAYVKITLPQLKKYKQKITRCCFKFE